MDYINGLRKHIGNAPLLMVGSTVLVLDARNWLLMMKRSDSGNWGVPGGAMELGETTEETARRELLEETGLEAGDLTLFGVFSGKELYYRYSSGEEVYNVSIVYLAHDAYGTVKLLDGEHDDFQYFDLANLPENVSPPIKPILRKLMKLICKMTEVLALIPARGGSKGIPRKNIRLFAGYPLIAWSIAAAKQSDLVTRVIVTTDDEEIAAVAREYGAEIPFLRPSELAQDKVTDLPVFEHALKWLEDVEGYRPDVIVQLRPTSPIRPRTLVDDAIRILLEHKDADCVRGVVPAAQNPFEMWRFNGEGRPLYPLLKVEGIAEPYNAPRQILPPVYWQTGHIDAIYDSTITHKKSLTGDVVYPFLIDPKYTVDIDTLSDWAKYEGLVYGGLEMVSPGKSRRVMPETIKLIICDFDGVVTDNLVVTDQDGKESVIASRSDSMHVKRLRELGVETMIISSEPNPVVMARAKKMGVEAIHNVGMQDKGRVMREVLEQKNIKAENVIYLGNDLNDLPCFEIAGWSVAVADAYPEVIRAADYVLMKTGGHGAIRELCELILNKTNPKGL